jgi:hypothetical protein
MRSLLLFVVLLASVYAQDRDDAFKINPIGCGARPNDKDNDANKIAGGSRANKGGTYLEQVFIHVIQIIYLFNHF